MWKNRAKNIQDIAVLYASTNNLGDDIQTLAQIEALKKGGIKKYSLLDREKLADYSGRPVNLIMGGWFVHDSKQFPPSKRINPIFISFHIKNESLVYRNRWYFKKHEPIGCRDTFTMNMLRKHGIESYLSKCLTLVFDQFKGNRRGCYVTDVNKISWIPNLPKKFVETNKLKDYQQLTHEIPDKYEEDLDYKLKAAQELLDVYRKAEMVITSRLHCTLPCRAFGTPVYFVHSRHQEDIRFGGLEDELNASNGSVGLEFLSPKVNEEKLELTKKKLLQDLFNRLKEAKAVD